MVLKRINNEFFKDIGNTSIGTSADSGDKKGKKDVVAVVALDQRMTISNHKAMASSRRASGLCFDFPKTDSTTYMVGTEDGIYIVALLVTMNNILIIILAMQVLYTTCASRLLVPMFSLLFRGWTINHGILRKRVVNKGIYYPFSSDLSDHVSDIRWSPYDVTYSVPLREMGVFRFGILPRWIHKLV